MKVIRVLKNWTGSIDFLSPSSDGRWGNCLFTEEETDQADGVLILNSSAKRCVIKTYHGQVFTQLLEPPTRFHQYLAKSSSTNSLVLGPRGFLKGAPSIELNCPMIPWHLGLSFSELMTDEPFSSKTRVVSTVTSLTTVLPEHRRRVKFLRALSKEVEFDWFGRGAQEISLKYDGLAPYRYALVYENYLGLDYWSEKVGDAFLAGCMPIYIGCTNLEDFFPKGSFVRVDPRSGDAAKTIATICSSNLAEEQRAAILEARHRVMNRFNLLSFFADRFGSGNAMDAPLDLQVQPAKQRNLLIKTEGWVRWKTRSL